MEEVKRIITIQTKGQDGLKKMRTEMKELRSQLLTLDKGTKEYNETLKRLSNMTRDYSDLNLAIRNSAADLGQKLGNITKATQGVVGGFNALNGVLALFGDASEDVQKTILKLQAGISIVQGLGSLEKLTKVLPALASNFRGVGDSIKGFFDSFFGKIDPFERKVNDIATKLNDMAIGDININATAASSSTNTVVNAGGQASNIVPAMKAETAARESGNKAILATNRELENLIKKKAEEEEAIEKAKKALEEMKGFRDGEVKTLKISEKELERQSKTYEEVNAKYSEYVEHSVKIDPTLKKQIDRQDELAEKIGETSRQLEKSKKAVAQYDEDIARLEKTIGKMEKETIKTNKAINGTDKAARAASKAVKGLKSVVAAAGFTIAVTAVIVALEKLIKLITDWGEKQRAVIKRQKELREELSKGEATAAKQIVAIQQLSRAYAQLGDDVKVKEQFLVDYADKIKETGVAIYDVNSAEEVFRNNTAAYIAALKERAKAQAAEQLAVKKYQEYLEKAGELEKQRDKSTGTNKQEYIDILMATGSSLEEAEKAWENSSSKTAKEVKRLKEQADAEVDALLQVADAANQAADATLKPMENAAQAAEDTAKKAEADKKQAEADAKAAAEAAKRASKEAAKQREAELAELNKGYDDIVNLRKTQEQKEIEQVNTRYQRLLDLAKKFGMDTVEIENAWQEELDRIRKKREQDTLDAAEKEATERWEVFQKELKRIRDLGDTSNLKQPREQTFQTNYTQGAQTAFHLFGKRDGEVDKYKDKGKSGSWLNTYQSKDDVENQYKAQIEYNDKLLALTKSRIEQENKLLNQQLENEQLTADQRYEIQRQLQENEMALSDATLDNEQANIEAYKKLQEAKQKALLSTIDVASSLTGTMATLFQQEMQMEKKKGETDEQAKKRQEDALKAYKVFATAQAIMDTYKAANEAYSAMASIPYVGPGLGAAAAIAAVAAGIANVRQIQQTQLNSSSSTVSASVPQAPVAMNQAPIQWTKELIGDKETDTVNEPIRCYVVESDITSTQNRVQVRQNNASF